MNCAYHTKNRRSCNVISARGPYVRLATIGFADSLLSGLYRSRRRDAALPAIALADANVIRRKTSRSFHPPIVFRPGWVLLTRADIKALVHFAIFASFFQMAVVTDGVTFFILGVVGTWLFAAVDACRTAQLMRAGLAPDAKKTRSRANYTETDRLGSDSGGARVLFLSHTLLAIQFPVRKMLPVALVALGAYILFDI